MAWSRQKLPCPVGGCEHKELQLAPLSDGDYEYVTCPTHGIQYPIPHTCVPQPLMSEFLNFVRRKPNNPRVARELVFRFDQWHSFAHEFMAQHDPRNDEAMPWQTW